MVKMLNFLKPNAYKISHHGYFEWSQSLGMPLNSFDWHISPAKIQATDTDSEEETDVALAEPELKKPPMYAVIIFNDDYTPMEFVVDILQKYFGHNTDTAVQIMYSVHYQGKGIAGIFPKGIAETKAQMVNREARTSGHPLMCQIEPYNSGE